MRIAEAFKEFAKNLTGVEPEGWTIYEVVKNTSGNSSLTLNSSTGGSDKKFKITVDDTGTITATEITE